jgi:hypothetical protein
MGMMNEAELDENFSPENLIRPLYRGKVYHAQDDSAALVGDPR